jgi:hypothetical protein
MLVCIRLNCSAIIVVQLSYKTLLPIMLLGRLALEKLPEFETLFSREHGVLRRL